MPLPLTFRITVGPSPEGATTIVEAFRDRDLTVVPDKRDLKTQTEKRIEVAAVGCERELVERSMQWQCKIPVVVARGFSRGLSDR